MIDRAGGGHRDRHAAHVEQHLMPLGPLPVVPQALHQNRRAANEQCLGQRQLHDREQNEDEQHRQRAGDAGQRYFQARSDDGQRQIAEKADQILRLPAG